MIICWRCKDEMAYQGKVPNHLTDRDGNKPCTLCLEELMADDPEFDEENPSWLFGPLEDEDE